MGYFVVAGDIWQDDDNELDARLAEAVRNADAQLASIHSQQKIDEGQMYWLLDEAEVTSPEDLLAFAKEYMTWTYKNPLPDEKVFHHRGLITRANVPRYRPASLKGFCSWLQVHISKIEYWKRQSAEFAKAVQFIIQRFEDYNYQLAAAGLLDPGFIARDLGMYEKVDPSTLPNNQYQDEMSIDEVKKEAERRGLPTRIFEL